MNRSTIKNSKPELPEGWVWCKLGEIGNFIRGVSYKGVEASLKPKENVIPILRAGNIQDGLILDDLVYVPVERVKQEQLIKSGDIVIAMSSGSKDIVGKAAQASFNWHGSFGTFCGVIRPARLINSTFVGFFFQTKEYRDIISSQSFGVNINNLRKNNILNFPIPLPPLPEQSLIVHRAEVLLERVKKAKEKLDKVPQIIKQFRQAVLKKAFSGELTAEWRKEHPEIEPAETLLKRIQEERKRQYEEEVKRAKTQSKKTPKKPKYLDSEPPDTSNLPELPEGWIWCNLDNLTAALESGGRPKGGVKNIRSGIPSIGGEHLNTEGGFCFDKIRYIPESYFEQMSKGIIRKNDILIVKDGATTGKTSFVDNGFPFEKAAVNEHVFILRGYPTIIEQRYLFRFLFSSEGQQEIQRKFQGSAQGGINTKFIIDFPIPLPPLPEQQEIVRRVETLFKFADEVEKKVKEAKERVEKITQSVLSKAFKGELTQDFRRAVKNWKNLPVENKKKYLFTLPEMEREKALHSDKFPLEPASVLLSRIKASKRKEKDEQLDLWRK